MALTPAEKVLIPREDDSSPSQMHLASRPKVRAFVNGAVVYCCPKCQRLNQITVNPRRPVTVCASCYTKYRLGLNFASEPLGPEPFNMRKMTVVGKQDYLNTLERRDGETGVGQVQGVVTFLCPTCKVRGHDKALMNVVECPNGHEWFVSLRLWVVKVGQKMDLLTPDWIVPA